MASPLFWLGYFAVIFTSTIIQSTLGFGFNIFGLIFLTQLFDSYPQAVAMCSTLCLFTTASLAIRLRQYINWRILAPCTVGYFLSLPIAIHLSVTLEKDLLMRLLGGFLILLSIYFITIGNRIRIRPTTRNGLIAGLIGGILSGLFGIGGPPVVIYFLSSLNEKNPYMATLQTSLTITGIYALIVRAMNGLFTAEMVGQFAVGTAAFAVGSVIGYRILKRIPLELMRKLIYALMIVSGVKMVLGL